MRTKCGWCPLLNDDRACPGQRNEAVCARADVSSPEHRPGVLQKLVSFTAAAVKHVAAGMPTATEEVKAERLAICNACEFFDAARQGCLKCGCSMDIKAGWADSRCPLDPPKWGPVEAAATEAEPAKVEEILPQPSPRQPLFPNRGRRVARPTGRKPGRR